MSIECMTETIDLMKVKDRLCEMIEIPSVTGNEAEISVYLEKKFWEAGADEVYRQRVDENRWNVVAKVCGKRKGPTTLLTGHVDTVSPGAGWSTDPYIAVERDGRIYGRGSNDMKGGIAVILETIRIAALNREELSGNVAAALLCDEEAYSLGAAALIKQGLKADFGISAEPEFKAMVVGAAGKILIEVEVEGLSAHAAHPTDGINAAEDAARFLAALESIPLISHEKIKAQPFVTLKIEGGAEEYSLVVPERCRILLNKHTVPGETKASVLKSLEELKKKLNLKSNLRFSIKDPFYPPYAVCENHPGVTELQDI